MKGSVNLIDVSPISVARQLLTVLYGDGDRLQRIDNYLHGRHDDPYMPILADSEYRLLAARAVSNWMPLLVGTPAQAMYVDGFRRGRAGGPRADKAVLDSPEWDHWQRSRLDARQAAVIRGALAYGHSFVVTRKDLQNKVTSKGLSAMNTAAIFEDPANDDTPYAALTVTSWPRGDIRGLATMWDDEFEYDVSFLSLGDPDSVRVLDARLHGATECPVTRFAASVDLEGRTTGVIEPMIALQNRINQTVFDLLIAQTYGSFKVRYVTGMAPPLERTVGGEIALDELGQPKALAINVNAKRFLFAEDPDVKFGSLDETPLGGYIESIDMSIRHLAAVSQTPPHYLLGQIANLSAEALTAAETALSRKVEEFRHAFGESWERVFRLAAQMSGVTSAADDFHGEVLWRDMESRSLAQSADALGKLALSLQIPPRGLWSRVPDVTQTEIAEWQRLHEEDDSAGLLATSLTRATAPATKPSVVSTTSPGTPAAAK